MWAQTFSFDPFGNVRKDVPPGATGIAFQPTYSNTHNWLTSLPGASAATDENGNVLNDGNHAYTWNAYGMMTSVDVTTKITYDAFGRAVEIEHSGSFTQIVYSPTGGKLAVMNGQNLVKALVRLPLGATAVYNSSGLAYIRHSDHLGSSRLATTPARTMYASAAYAPYGEAYAQAGATDLSFTGQDQDTTSGMYDFMLRKYNPVQGRWLSPDPAGLGAVDPANPQTWNRYAYVGNNPLSLIDPLGADAYEGCDPHIEWWCFDGSWTAWIRGLNQMSGWGDPFRVLTFSLSGGYATGHYEQTCATSNSSSTCSSTVFQIDGYVYPNIGATALIGAGSPILPVWEQCPGCHAGCTGPGIPCRLSQAPHLPTHFGYTSYTYTVRDVNCNVVKGVDAVSEYFSDLVSHGLEPPRRGTWNRDNSLFDLAFGQFVDNLHGNYTATQSFSALVGGGNYVISTTSSMVASPGSNGSWPTNGCP